MRKKGSCLVKYYERSSPSLHQWINHLAEADIMLMVRG
jgi:hypothetical protein